MLFTTCVIKVSQMFRKKVSSGDFDEKEGPE